MKQITNLKICGVTNPEVGFEAAHLGADFVGVVFAPLSPRKVSLSKAALIAERIRKGGAKPVAIVTDATADEMNAIINETDITIMQLHGKTSRAEHTKLPEHIQRIFVLHINQNGQIVNNKDYINSQLIIKRDYLLFDGMQGGSGSRPILGNIQYYSTMRYFIAGGLTPYNVEPVIKRFAPFGVDVSSGVEYDRGKKDVNLIKLMITKTKDPIHALTI